MTQNEDRSQPTPGAGHFRDLECIETVTVFSTDHLVLWFGRAAADGHAVVPSSTLTAITATEFSVTGLYHRAADSTDGPDGHAIAIARNNRLDRLRRASLSDSAELDGFMTTFSGP